MVNAPEAQGHPASPADLASTDGKLGHNGHDGKQEVDGEADKLTSLPPPEVAQTIPCKFFPLGQCKYGDSCAFSHKGMAGGFAEQQQQPQQPSQQPHSASGLPSPVSVTPGSSSSPVVTTTAVDYNGFPMAPMPPPYLYYGMPQQYYPPMQYSGYVDANGYPVPIMGQPYVDFSGQSPPVVTQAGASPHSMVQPLPEGIESPRLMEGHPSLAEHMAAMSLAQSQMSPPPFPMSPTLLPQGMSPMSPTFNGAESRRLSTSQYYSQQQRPMGRQSMSAASRRSSTVGADPSVRTASAIISFPASPNTPMSPSSPTSRSFGSHSRYSTEPGRPMGSGMGPKGSYPCAFFPENRCKNGDHCKYTHLLPSGDDARHLKQGMIGVDGRTRDPAEASKTFVFPARGGGRGMGPFRGGMGGRGNGLGRSYGARTSFGAYCAEEMQGGVMADGIEPARRYVDDEARERVERFIESTRSTNASRTNGVKPTGPAPAHAANGLGQKVPSVGDFPALANEGTSTPLSPKLNGAANGDETPVNGSSELSPPLSANKLAGSFASAAARGAKALVPNSTSVKGGSSPLPAEPAALPPVAVGASA